MQAVLTSSLKHAFSIIEVMIGVFIFSLGLVAIYALLISSLSLSDYNRHAIVASQLAVEQIEIVRNIRDTNYKTLKAWDYIPGIDKSLSEFDGDFLKIENDFSSGKLADITVIHSFEQGKDKLAEMQSYRLCLKNNIYTYDCSGGDVIQTPYYRYLQIEQQGDESLRITSKVIWYARGYHEYDITTLITDWRRL